jgi:hypothetical protein
MPVRPASPPTIAVSQTRPAIPASLWELGRTLSSAANVRPRIDEACCLLVATEHTAQAQAQAQAQARIQAGHRRTQQRDCRAEQQCVATRDDAVAG